MMPTNIFTVDLEEWYHANYRPCADGFAGRPSTLVTPTMKLLDLLGRYKNKATFFCLGSVAQAHPELIREISRRGHEIASHSYLHKLVYQQSVSEFAQDLARSTAILSDIVGRRPIGYRAPSWSVDRVRTPWFWKALAEHGYKYSSSLFPLTTFLYGDSSAPRFRHQIGGVMEIPPSTLSFFGRRMGFSGGFYLRLIPALLLRAATRVVNSSSEPAVFYIHPREIDPSQPRIEGLTARERFIHYYNIGATLGKIEGILRRGRTCSIQGYFRF